MLDGETCDLYMYYYVRLNEKPRNIYAVDEKCTQHYKLN